MSSYVTPTESHAAALCARIYMKPERRHYRDEKEYYDELIVNGHLAFYVMNRGTVTGIQRHLDTLFIVYRGTASREDIAYDARGGKMQTRFGPVRRGFYQGHRRTYSQIRDVIEAEDPREVVICGHSLGAASGLCAMIDIWEHFPQLQTRLRFVGFGGPRVLGYSTAHTLHLNMPGRISSFIRPGDPVPSVPPMITGWRHPVDLIYMRGATMDRRANASMPVRFLKSLVAAGRGAVSFGQGHGMARYLSDIQRVPVRDEVPVESISSGSQLVGANGEVISIRA